MAWSLSVALLVLGLARVASAQAPANIYYNSFEFLDMRQWAFDAATQTGAPTGMYLMTPGEQPSGPSGQCLGANGRVCTGFYTQENSFTNQVVNDPANCHNSSGWCMRFNIPAGTPVGSGYHLWSGYTPGNIPQGCAGPNNANCIAAAGQSNLYYRYFIKFALDFRLFADPSGNGACQGKLFYMRDNRGNGTGDTSIVRFRTNTSNNQLLIDWEFSTSTGTCCPQTFTITPDNAWHSLEMHWNTVTHQVELWWDDQIKVSATTPTDTKNPIFIDANAWGLYINNNADVGATKGDRCTAPNSTQFWIDDLAVSTTRIGGGAVITPPPAPSGLKVIIN
jgi:hypothetical protein